MIQHFAKEKELKSFNTLLTTLQDKFSPKILVHMWKYKDYDKNQIMIKDFIDFDEFKKSYQKNE